MLFLANMQIISLNMHDTKMAQAKINSTEKIGLGTTKKLLVPKFIELLWEYPCLLLVTFKIQLLNVVNEARYHEMKSC